MIALLGIVTVLLEYIDRLLYFSLKPCLLLLCSMLLVTYYAFNYVGIIGRSLLNYEGKLKGKERQTVAT